MSHWNDIIQRTIDGIHELKKFGCVIEFRWTQHWTQMHDNLTGNEKAQSSLKSQSGS